MDRFEPPFATRSTIGVVVAPGFINPIIAAVVAHAQGAGRRLAMSAAPARSGHAPARCAGVGMGPDLRPRRKEFGGLRILSQRKC